MHCLRSIALGLVFLMAAHLAGASEFSSKEPLALRKVIPNTNALPCFGLFELTLDLAATFDNPFDPADIDVHAEFQAPDGTATVVAGFFGGEFTRELENGAERIAPAAPPAWKIRFAPRQPGKWRYEVKVRDRSGEATLAPASFEALPSRSAGHVRLATNGAPYFMLGNGQPYFPVGENMCWGGKRGLYDYEEWLPELAKAGGNFIRVWMSSWNCALEWSAKSQGDWRSGNYHGVGVYSLDNAWKLDALFDLAERHGVSIMLCLGTYGELRDGGYFGEGQWKANPYNTANGGPCAKPADLWTDETARRLYRQRLRYLGARYGYRANLHSWEFWNEAEAPAPWVAEMAECLKGTGRFQGQPADPYGHLVSTTYGKPEVWKIPEIDFTQTHTYGIGDVPDQAPVIVREARAHATFGKPHWMAEFGMDWRSPDTKYDAEGKGVNLHNGLWASALSGDAGAAMIWWWDSYVHPKRLYAPFGALRQFTDTVPWTEGRWTKWDLAPADPPTAGSLTIHGLSNGRAAIAWIHNTAHNWKNVYEKKPIPTVSKTALRAAALPAGRYRLERWDTWKGGVTKSEEVVATETGVTLTLPELETDVAIRLTPSATQTLGEGF